MNIHGMSREEAVAFSAQWLPAWTGNRPELLASFYSEDCEYTDASNPGGVKGRLALTEYFRKLLAQNPRWVWTQLDAIPMEGGFVNKYLAAIPVGDRVLEIIGVCLVWIGADGLIRRNDVYFDRADLIQAIAAHRAIR